MGSRRKNVAWTAPDETDKLTVDHAKLQTLQDIRDVLLDIAGLMRCYRIPRALDALASMGVAARRRRKRIK